MPFASIRLRPGIQVEATQLLNESGYSASSFGRFRAGLFEKLGGWVKYVSTTFGSNPRAVWAWQDFSANKRLAIATTTNVGVVTNASTTQSIVPQSLTSSGSIGAGPTQLNFSTVMNTNVVTVYDGNVAAATTLDTVEFLTPISVGGIILSGAYQITLFAGANLYQITAASNASSTVNNGGAIPVFTTSNGSNLVSVSLANDNLNAGNKVVFGASTTNNGVTIQGVYTVVSTTPPNTFVISASTQANNSGSFTMNSGNVQAVYSIGIGPPSSSNTGWGVLGWGSSPWGGLGSIPGATTGTAITATDWTLQNWGDTLLACPQNGGVYQWGPTTGNQNLAQVGTAPAHNNGIVVAVPAQILIAFGTSVTQSIGINQDPLTYAWSDQLDYTFWKFGTTNPNTGLASQAGNNRIPTGSAIIAGLAVPQQVLLWTDLDLWAINYIGNVAQGLIFGQTKIGANCGTLGLHSVGQLAGIVYWWGRNNFYVLTGSGVQVLPCTVWDVVFQNINNNFLSNCWVETIQQFNEVWFFYPSAASSMGTCDSYAKVNVVDGSWDFGSLPRSAGIDQSIVGNPIMCTPQGTIYLHETGFDADGQALTPSFTTGYFLIGDGEDYAFVDQFLPDFKYQFAGGAGNIANIQITFSVINFQGDTPRVYGPYNLTSITPQLFIRFRGRLMAMTVSGMDIGTWWRMGRNRYRWAPDGRL